MYILYNITYKPNKATLEEETILFPWFWDHGGKWWQQGLLYDIVVVVAFDDVPTEPWPCPVPIPPLPFVCRVVRTPMHMTKIPDLADCTHSTCYVYSILQLTKWMHVMKRLCEEIPRYPHLLYIILLWNNITGNHWIPGKNARERWMLKFLS